MSTAVSPDLRRMTSQPTITLSAPAPVAQTSSNSTTSASKPAAVSPSATPTANKASSPVPLLPSPPSHSAPSARPQSIPSSPTSVHSSSSAIFERDIEPIGFQSSPLKNTDPHHTSRAQTHESTEQAVPSVLTSAVSALSVLDPSTPTSPTGGVGNRRSIYDDGGEISVISPAPAPSAGSPGAGPGGASLMLSGMLTPRSLSRSPSPPVTATAGASSFSQQQTGTGTVSPPISILGASTSRRSASPRPADGNTASPPTSYKPIAASFTGVDDSETPTSSSSHPPPARADSTSSASGFSAFVPGSGPIPRTRPSQTSLAPTATSPISGVGVGSDAAAEEALSAGNPNRLSFISYHDLLVSTPLSTAPLSSLTSGTSQTEPSTSLSASMSTLPAQPPPQPPLSATSRSGASSPGTSPPRGRTTAAHATVVGWGKEDGGEWEREGLGKSLEERLEEVIKAEQGGLASPTSEGTQSPTR